MMLIQRKYDRSCTNAAKTYLNPNYYQLSMVICHKQVLGLYIQTLQLSVCIFRYTKDYSRVLQWFWGSPSSHQFKKNIPALEC